MLLVNTGKIEVSISIDQSGTAKTVEINKDLAKAYFQEDACYACPTNKERNSIQKSLFQKHIKATHPSITSNKLPPNHTLIIEANISSSVSKKSQHKIDRHLKNRILTTCGDADVMSGTKHIDPALCI